MWCCLRYIPSIRRANELWISICHLQFILSKTTQLIRVTPREWKYLFFQILSSAGQTHQPGLKLGNSLYFEYQSNVIHPGVLPRKPRSEPICKSTFLKLILPKIEPGTSLSSVYGANRWVIVVVRSRKIFQLLVSLIVNTYYDNFLSNM